MPRWKKNELETAVSLWEIGTPIKTIAEKLDRTVPAISALVNRRKDLFLFENKRKIRVKNNFRIPIEILIREGKIEVEEPPKEVPIPEGATHTPWIELQDNQCQWALNGFWDGGSMNMPCCGLPVADPKAPRGDIRRRFCAFHVKQALKEEK